MGINISNGRKETVIKIGPLGLFLSFENMKDIIRRFAIFLSPKRLSNDIKEYNVCRSLDVNLVLTDDLYENLSDCLVLNCPSVMGIVRYKTLMLTVIELHDILIH